MSSYEYIKINKYSNLRQQLLAPILWEAQFLCIIQGQHPQSGWAHEGSYQPNQNGLNKKKNVSTFHHCQNYKIKKILSIFTRSRSSLLSFSLFSFSRVGPCKQGGPIANQNSERKLYIVFNTKIINKKSANTWICYSDVLLYSCQEPKSIMKTATRFCQILSYLMLHPDPKFVHFSEILEYKLNSIHDSISIPVRVKEHFSKWGPLGKRAHTVNKN